MKFSVFKSKLLFVIGIIVVIGIVTGLVLSNNNKTKEKETALTKIILSNEGKIEINSEVQLLMVLKIQNGKILSDDEKIDTSKLGEQEFTIKYLNENDEEKEYTFKITIIDTKAPIIEFKKELTTIIGTKIELLSDVKVTDNSKEDIKVIVEGEYDFNKEGIYNLKYIAVDSSGNKAIEEFILKVNKKTSSSNTNSNNENNTNTKGITLSKTNIEIQVGKKELVELILNGIDLKDISWDIVKADIITIPVLVFQNDKIYYQFSPYNIGTTKTTISSSDGKHKATITIKVVIATNYSNEILNLVNKERTKAGLSPVIKPKTSLVDAVNLRASELNTLFSHTRPNGTDCYTVLDQYGITRSGAGENIADGYKTPEQVMAGWMNSVGHKNNILNPNWTELGVGVNFKNGKLSWVQMFIY